MGLTYKCLAIEGDRVNMVLLHLDRLPGDIASIEFTVLLSDSQREDVEIEDRDECRRLEDLVAKLGYPGT